MNTGSTIAIAAVVLVVIAVGAIFLLKPRPVRLSPEQQIGAGIGNLVSGIIGVATASGDE